MDGEEELDDGVSDGDDEDGDGVFVSTYDDDDYAGWRGVVTSTSATVAASGNRTPRRREPGTMAAVGAAAAGKTGVTHLHPVTHPPKPPPRKKYNIPTNTAHRDRLKHIITTTQKSK